jgi:hypothetical protein
MWELGIRFKIFTRPHVPKKITFIFLIEFIV